MAAYKEDDDGYLVIAAAYDDDGDDGFAIAAASEEEDDDYIMVNTTFVPSLPLPSSSSSHACAASTASSSAPAPYDVHAEEQISPSSSPAAATHCVDVVHDAAALWQQDAVAVDEALAAQVYFSLYRRSVSRRPNKLECEIVDEAAAADEDEEEEEEEGDYMYQGYYDLADRGRARHVKRSSGRRGRTKKASMMERRRFNVRLAHCSGDL